MPRTAESSEALLGRDDLAEQEEPELLPRCCQFSRLSRGQAVLAAAAVAVLALAPLVAVIELKNPPACEASCSGHGACAHDACSCDAGWNGSSCESPTCDDTCGEHEACTIVAGGNHTCRCTHEWAGARCNVCRDQWEHVRGHDKKFGSENLSLAMAYLEPLSSSHTGAAAVCPLSEMRHDAGNLAVASGQTLAIAGSAKPTSATSPPPGHSGAPRLWARFAVSGVLYVSGVTIRNQSISQSNYDEPGGAAAEVHPGGQLVAVGVSFLSLTTTTIGGAVLVRGGGLANIHGCLFDGCRATDPCGDPRSGGGSAIYFRPGAAGTVIDSVLRNNHVFCNGGAIVTEVTQLQHPFKTNVTIKRSTFANNHANADGDDIFVWLGNHLGTVPCPAPGKGCDARSGTTRCCIDGGNESLTVTLACN